MKIVVDAMGGDQAPAVVVDGAVQAARESDIEVILVGQRGLVQAELEKHNTAGLPLTLKHASEVIEMHEHPAAAVRAKKDNSMIVGMEMLKRREADAFFTAGNSGGALAAALFRLGRIRGVKRPALSTVFPSQTPQGFCFILDIGANTDCRPEYLLQFAMMGAVYAERVLGVPNPPWPVSQLALSLPLSSPTVSIMLATSSSLRGTGESEEPTISPARTSNETSSTRTSGTA